MMTVIWILVAIYVPGVLWFYATEWAFICHYWFYYNGPSRLRALHFAMRWPYELVRNLESMRDNLTAHYGFRL